jgi:hypothetical protein
MAPQVGSPGDIAARLRAALPLHWFADDAPVLDAVLAGLGDGWARLYQMLQVVRRQSRIGRADGAMLDMIAGDFFGAWLGRRPGQGDDPFRATILRELLRERATRAGLAAALADLTGREPQIFEPSRPADTGAWGLAAGYNAGGGYGSLALPFQCFVRARRPPGAGIASVAGYEGLRGDGLTDARAVSSRSTDGSYFDATGTLQTAAPGVVRIDWTTGAPLLLAEGASANYVRNPRAEAAAAGSIGGGGALPTYWGDYATNGLACVVVGTGTEAGIPYVDLRWFGTASGGTATATVFPEPAGIIAASVGQTWTASVYVKLIAGTAPANLALNVIESDSGKVYLAGSGVNISSFVAGSGPLAAQRISYTRSLAATTVAYTYLTVTGSATTGNSLDFTLRIGGFQIEQAAAASSLILPPAGNPGITKRSGETIAIPATLPGGYGAGAIEYASADMVQGQVTDADIYATAARSMPAATIAWTAIAS